MICFTINGIEWTLQFVPGTDEKLMRSDGVLTLGVTDANLRTIFISDRLTGNLLYKVICHELCHCFCFSYGIYIDLRTEELIADFLATYGCEVFAIADEILCRFSFTNAY